MKIERAINAKFELDYKEDIVKYMIELEELTMASPDMMDLQPELEWYMRPFLLDFLIEVHAGFRLQPTTLHLAINIIDRYTSKRVVFKKHYQLLGCTALWIAAKYEEAKDKVPLVKELRAMCCDSYREQMFLQMEGHVLKTLEWNIGAATTDAFLQVQLTEPMIDDSNKTLHLARMFTEIALFHREFVSFRPQYIADGALHLARQILDQNTYGGKRSYDTDDVVFTLRSKMAEASPVLMKKYALPAYEKVAIILKDFLDPPVEVQYSRPPTPPTSGMRVRHPGRLDATSELTPVRISQSRAYSRGMITPPLDADDCLPTTSFCSEPESYDCSSSEASLSPITSSCASILDSYHEDCHNYKSSIVIS
ncbi:putative G1/S-specific cyclin [Taphrina deformans PYCC 5710]|uniref:G1/S-specific cyclin n=1 Tax=Taphrina deformans (strain PYCC 5710 / ATCC 11124 / CBS 356.35 / IMI 108563 / JCM 9778 / NBRC 8474) TaxID=1097556 RepID=R4X9Y5_TAPDE|nr:putative G1/S-specific cyclin [Taphrina deformans PYCC 5710]|eukprot:CCG81054.1 putative G1/S-specific cyclin [Taphrina deformans PYCC 5710]